MIRPALDLWLKYKETGDKKFLEELLNVFDDLIHYWASKFTSYGEPLEDLIQIGYLGFLKAIENYDPKKGELSTYISHYVLGEIRHHLRDKIDKIKIPRSVKILINKMDNFIKEVWEKENRSPSCEEIAKHLNITVESVDELFKIKEAMMTVSIEDLEIEVDRIRTERLESFKLPIEEKIALEQAISKLPEIQKKIIEYIFYQDLTQTEVAKILKISQTQVSRLLKSALEKLREML
ncbi:RNA polymerase, sigma 28 subunit, FliA/WhiG subfamily [Dictyoglomus turgidum DSM 6724]|uniref:RNA polymerase, sigma 28 subunit, FliA/WhiG subfamily n=1 Tax=Dictyoglomus turgidum (strain DSM 6724 / Z-1310) TaxID=515635 RepID=B8E074_DICTD|nr:RNA polymerase, sigma 28 subunit, FliA/WhiG subfamily [Dictyoglomus turgidum DSM 6724]PNV79000.1 MAG: flagellar biosynthesis protein FliA [Dictyoglomus turgidum]HBU32387.1 flagellar biosynthesis protein FliA [Dictyoglomus sp.]